MAPWDLKSGMSLVEGRDLLIHPCNPGPVGQVHQTTGGSAALEPEPVLPVLRLFIHPEMERLAILNKSMPSTAGATIGIPPSATRGL